MNAVAIGTRVEIHWAVEKRWFAGTIVGWDAADRTHHVKYDDGDEMWHDLLQFKWRYKMEYVAGAAAAAASVTTTRTHADSSGGAASAVAKKRKRAASGIDTPPTVAPLMAAPPATVAHAALTAQPAAAATASAHASSRSPIRYRARRVTCSPGGTKCVRFVETAVPIEAGATSATSAEIAAATADGTAQQLSGATAERVRSPSPSLLLVGSVSSSTGSSISSSSSSSSAANSDSTAESSYEKYGTIAREAMELLGSGADARTLVADYDRAEKTHARCRAKLWLALLKRHQEFMERTAAGAHAEGTGSSSSSSSSSTSVSAAAAARRLSPGVHRSQSQSQSQSHGGGARPFSLGSQRSSGSQQLSSASQNSSGESGSSGSLSSSLSGGEAAKRGKAEKKAGGDLADGPHAESGNAEYASSSGECALEPAIAAKRTLQLAARVNPARSNTHHNGGMKPKQPRDNTTPPRIIRPRFDGNMVSQRSARGRSPLGKRPASGGRYF